MVRVRVRVWVSLYKCMEVMKPSLSVHIHLERNEEGNEQLDVCNIGASHNMWVEQ